MGFYPASAAQSVAGNLTVAGTITTTSPSFPAILASAGSVRAAGFTSTGSPNAFDASSAGGGLRVSESANGKQGSATLTAGTVAVSNTSVTASSRIALAHTTPGGTPGALFLSSVTVGSGFTITSTSSTDTSVVGYEIFEPG